MSLFNKKKNIENSNENFELPNEYKKLGVSKCKTFAKVLLSLLLVAGLCGGAITLSIAQNSTKIDGRLFQNTVEVVGGQIVNKKKDGYDSGELIKVIADNPQYEHKLAWNGHNDLPDWNYNQSTRTATFTMPKEDVRLSIDVTDTEKTSIFKYTFSGDTARLDGFKSGVSKNNPENLIMPSKIIQNNTNKIYSVTDVCKSAFTSNIYLKTLTILDSITKIGPHSFFGCANLSNITFGNELTMLETYAFFNCVSLEGELILPDSLKEVGYGAFAYCAKLSGLKFNDGLEVIKLNAFEDCSGLLGDLVIPNSVVTVETLAFCKCSQLTSITFPDSVATIGERALAECGKLTNISVSRTTLVKMARNKEIDFATVGDFASFVNIDEDKVTVR